MNAYVPTTSKCGECDYHSQDESDMKKHVQSSHECKCKVCSIVFSTELLLSEHVKKEHESTVDRSEEENQDVEKVRCPECEYTAKSEWYLDDHMLDKHNFPCGDCCLIFRTMGRLRNHICKLPINNPTFGSLYSKSWWDGNGCNPIFCHQKNQEVAWLHHNQCWSNVKTCHLSKNQLLKETNGIYHLEIDQYIIYCEIQWEALAQTISK